MVYTTTTYPKDLAALLESMGELNPADRELVEHAYYYAEEKHRGYTRESGEPYFTHCLAVATILADMRMDAETIAAGLLHDVIEDTAVTPEEFEAEFGKTLLHLVDGVTKLKKMPTSSENGNANKNGSSTSKHGISAPKDLEYFRKMMLMMDSDIRVVLIKLADRLHNMRTLGYMAPDKQRKKALETQEIYVPLANRLGIWQVKWELEDLAFRYLQPDAYKAIVAALQERRVDREAYVARVAEVLRAELEKYGICNAHITARPKHIASIYNKMHRKGIPLERVYDVRAVRVIVDEVPQCYLVLGVVHQLWKPIPGEFDDYIGTPKDNFYRSLHTAVMDDQGRTLEVQIRTWQMHEDAEYGIAAHWRYKEGGRLVNDERFEKRIAFLRRLMDGTETATVSAQEFFDHMKSNFFEGRIYVFTPKGDMIDLPVGSTPIDFAYAIHTEIGHRCRGAKVRGKLVPLNYVLNIGDQVEILTAKRGGPSLDWLNPNAGYVTTSRAREKIRHFFRKERREININSGRMVLQRELRRLGVLDKVSLDAVASAFDFSGRLDDFLVEIGIGNITGAQIALRVLEMDGYSDAQDVAVDESEELQARLRPPAPSNVSDAVTVLGAEGLMLNIARCCNPLPGDPIVGYVTRGRGVMVHRADCQNILANTERERLLDIKWGSKRSEQRYDVPIEVVAHDRPGLLRDVSALIAEMNINMSSVNVSTKRQIATLYITLQIAHHDQLSRVLSKLEQIPSVTEARRRKHA